MINEEKSFIAMCKFLLWLFTALVISFIGLSGVFALTNNNNLRFYDNNGSSLTYVETSYTTQTGESTAIFTTTANSYGGAVMLQATTPLVQNHIYTIFLNVGAYNYGGQTQASTKNCVGLGTTYASAISSYINCNVSPRFTQSSGVTTDKERGLYFTFIANANATYILLPYTTANTCNDCMQYSYGYNINDAGDSSNLTQSQVNTIINNQTTNITNSITQSQNAITNNSNANRDAIINNQNANNDALIENNNKNSKEEIESQRVCTQISKENIKTDSYLQTNGVIEDNDWARNTFGITDYLTAKNSTFRAINIYDNASSAYCFYDEDYNLLSCRANNTMTENGLIDLPTNTAYVRFSINKNSDLPRITYCSSGNQAIADKMEEQNKTSKGIFGKLRDLFDTLFSDDDADISGLNNMVGWLPPGPVDSIINLPLSFFNSLTNTLTGTCRSVSLNIPFVNQTLFLPCFDAYMSQYLTGFNTLWTFVGVTLSVFILYYYLLSLYKWVDDTLTFRENNLPGYYGDNWGGGA